MSYSTVNDSTTGSNGSAPQYNPHRYFDLTTGMTKYEWSEEQFPTVIEDGFFEHPDLLPNGLHFANQSSKIVNYFLYRARADKNGVLTKVATTPMDNFEIPSGSAYTFPIPPTGYVVDIYGPLLNYHKMAGRAIPMVLWQGFKLSDIQNKFIKLIIEPDKPNVPQVYISKHRNLSLNAWGEFWNTTPYELRVVISRPHSLTTGLEVNSYNTTTFVPDSGGKKILKSIIEAGGKWEYHIPVRHWFIEACETREEQEGAEVANWTDDVSQNEGKSGNRVVLTSTTASRGSIIVTLTGAGSGNTPAVELVVTSPNKCTLVTTDMVLNRAGIPHYAPDTGV